MYIYYYLFIIRWHTLFGGKISLSPAQPFSPPVLPTWAYLMVSLSGWSNLAGWLRIRIILIRSRTLIRLFTSIRILTLIQPFTDLDPAPPSKWWESATTGLRPLQLPNFGLHAFHSNADPDSASKINADPDPQHCYSSRTNFPYDRYYILWFPDRKHNWTFFTLIITNHLQL